MTIKDFNQSFYYQPYPNDNWNEQTDLIEQTELKLRRLLGQAELKVKTKTGVESTNLEGYFNKGYPSCALEVIEQFAEEVAGYGDSGRTDAARFQAAVNEAMVAFECPWRLSDGRFFQVEASFLHKEVVQKADDILREIGFEGAHDEFREAREDLADKQTKDAILKSFKSFESTLKTVLDKHNGDINDLIRIFREAAYMDDIPDDKAKAVCKQVLTSIAGLRNELAGHGQGNAVVDVPRPYAALAVHLAGALNQFIIDQYLRKRPQTDKPRVAATEANAPVFSDDDVPF